MVVHLTPDVESALARAARRQGVAPDALANQTLRERFVDDVEMMEGTAREPADGSNGVAPRNLFEFLGDSIGMVGGDDPEAPATTGSENTGERFREILQKRRAEGRL